MQVGRSNTIFDPKYILGDCLLPNLTFAKNLGVTIDIKFNFNTNVSIITGRDHARAYLIREGFVSRNTQSLVRGFVTYVRAIIEYASSNWSPSIITNIKRLNRFRKVSQKA